MLGEKKTVPLWSQRKPNLLAQERALAQQWAMMRESAWPPAVRSKPSKLQASMSCCSKNCLNRSRSWQRSRMKTPAASMLKPRSTCIP